LARQELHLRVNGDSYQLTTDPLRSLADVLREDLGLVGTKIGCNEGHCGACTVLLDGRSICSCLTLAVAADGCEVTTIEGLACAPDDLHPVQRAFVDRGAVQCGFCSPGMILSTVDLLAKSPHPSEDEVRSGLSGNMCRCTGYTKIVDAVMAAADDMAGTEDG
jgi:carbon-monoxide dehydrogenase small subunit